MLLVLLYMRTYMWRLNMYVCVCMRTCVCGWLDEGENCVCVCHLGCTRTSRPFPAHARTLQTTAARLFCSCVCVYYVCMCKDASHLDACLYMTAATMLMMMIVHIAMCECSMCVFMHIARAQTSHAWKSLSEGELWLWICTNQLLCRRILLIRCGLWCIMFSMCAINVYTFELLCSDQSIEVTLSVYLSTWKWQHFLFNFKMNLLWFDYFHGSA